MLEIVSLLLHSAAYCWRLLFSYYIQLSNVEDYYSPIIFCCLLLEIPVIFGYLMLVLVSLPLYAAS